ncbi:hypothetical protein Ahy_A02g005160 isoform B [Arachis hypogaea]|uniref:RNase H type-1 domain-containing protein n=1 Tax=Arachis hypogaea TaxID=3818 RepID=A0A445E6C1_ARAHY|nr:hypothetical protein Ahy_A02g005160 isoform B [Arachis hypogaea]
MFLWKACHNILAVNYNLFTRKIIKKPTCSICQEAEETVEHALLLCPWTRAVWFGSQIQCSPTPNNVTSFAKWLLAIVNRLKAEDGCGTQSKINNLAFITINKEAEFRKSTEQKEKVKEVINNRHRKQITWRPPPNGWMKISIDASFDKETGQAASAAVIRNCDGKVLSGSTMNFKTISPLAVEAHAMRDAMILSKNLQLGRCLIETDSLIDAVLNDIFELINNQPEVGLTWTPREGNELAHKVAKMASSRALGRQWCVRPPKELARIIKRDERVTASVKRKIL